MLLFFYLQSSIIFNLLINNSHAPLPQALLYICLSSFFIFFLTHSLSPLLFSVIISSPSSPTSNLAVGTLHSEDGEDEERRRENERVGRGGRVAC